MLKNNDIERNIYKKIWFVEEGIKRKCCYKSGKYLNMIFMSILKEEFVVDGQEK